MFVVCECMDSVMHASIMVKKKNIYTLGLETELSAYTSPAEEQRNNLVQLVDWFGSQVLPNCSLKTSWRVSGCYCNV